MPIVKSRTANSEQRTANSEQRTANSEQRTANSEQRTASKPSVEFVQPLFILDDLILPQITLSSIQDFLAYQKYETQIFNDWGLIQTHKHQRQIAINLYGLPGTGKTMAAHAIAHHLQKPLIAVNYSDIESKYVGETSKNITVLFKQAQEHNAIIFFDEADAILSRRVTNMSHATDVSVNQTRSVLLTLMNEHDGLIIFTTNFIENYDPAFMRRILAHILFELPDLDNRIKLWEKYIPKKLPTNISPLELAKISDGLSGSDIANCVLKSAMNAAREELKILEIQHFQKAINEVKASQQANRKQSTKVTQKIVNEEYVTSQIGEDKVKELKV